MNGIHLRPRLIAARFLFLSTLSVLAISHADAATYYVNASTGNDTWTGTHADPVTSSKADGPWRTLAKVNATTLHPGDSVLLHCGQTWYESLTIAGSGTVENPINVGPYPASCSQPPLISGMVPIPSYAWTPYKNNIYKTQFPINLVQNSSFDSNLSTWFKYSPNGDARFSSQLCNGAGSGQCLAIATRASYANAATYTFPIHAAMNYTLSLAMKAPAGVKVALVVRRGKAPWEAAGLSVAVSGTGSWQTLNFPFVATETLDNARVDIVVPAGNHTALVNNVVLSENMPSVSQVFANGVALNPAHHPNAGFNPSHPTSVYLRMAADSNNQLQANGTHGSTYITAGSDLVLPAGGALSTGLTVRVRTSPWTLDERTITSAKGTGIWLDRPTSRQAKAGFGYFLLGALWMLDSPGEWFYDATAKALYVQMPDNAAPSSRITIGQTGDGVRVDGKSNINISGIWIQGTDQGVSMVKSNNVHLSNSLIEKTQAEGVDARMATEATIADNTIRSTGRDAIFASASRGLGTRQMISGNAISESGVRIVHHLPNSLPVPLYAAISAGEAATVTHNTIQNSGYHGIRIGKNSVVSDNWVDHACMILDDCGGVYTSGENTASRIERNLVTNIPGTYDGKPATNSHTVGIYLDEYSSNVAVAGNSIVGADAGLQVHDGTNNLITDNTFYGNRQYQLYFYESTAKLDSSGDLHDNTILDNSFVPTSASEMSVYNRSSIGDTSRFAHYDRNMYSTLKSSTIALEGNEAGLYSYTFPMWQAATVSGVPRDLDPMGSAVAVKGFASYSIAGGNQITNGNSTAGIAGWTHYEGKAFSSNNCTNSPCLQFTVDPDAAHGLVSSPSFSVRAGQYYRVSFDFKTGTANQRLAVLVRRGGGGSNGYEFLQGAAEPLVGTTSWQRHAYYFRAPKTVTKDDPVTGDQGARLDFQEILTGQTIFIDNVEVVPVTPVGLPSKMDVLVNNTDAVAAMDCPDKAIAPAYCSQYVRFADTTQIAWPHNVQPLSAEVIYTLDRTSPDSDNDGIPDSQDSCPHTAAKLATNSKGCAINQ
jgi:parallel beta-helix repeat protein